MLDYSKCSLYKLSSKKQLKRLLKITDDNFLKQEFLAKQFSPYIDRKGKPRLIEPPTYDVKMIQRRIKRLLYQIEFPDNIFSGIPKRSYAQNAAYHAKHPIKSMYKIDLRGFFPSISRNSVYKFFLSKMQCSPDIAEILTNLTTVDIEKANSINLEQIHLFLKSKKVKCTNHLISGAPTSQILSYLVNQDMFNELQTLSDANHIKMSIYVDDITFSGNCHISNRFRRKVLEIIKKYNYKISAEKTKFYTKDYPKTVTGVIISSDNNTKISNHIQNAIIKDFSSLKMNPDDDKTRKRLRGYLSAARQVDKNAFQGIYNYVYPKKTK